MNKNKVKRLNRIRRHTRVRAKVSGTSKTPRVSVFRSNQHMIAQFVDDTKVSKTLLSGNTNEKGLKGNKSQVAQMLGEKLGKIALDKGIKEVIFDKGGFKYHGRIKAFADGLRSAGLKF